MSEPVARQRPIINLDEFERRLRQPAATSSRKEDPLAELARLVGGEHDPYQGVFEDNPQADFQQANFQDDDRNSSKIRAKIRGKSCDTTRAKAGRKDGRLRVGMSSGELQR